MNKNFDDKYPINEKILENIFSEIWRNSTKNEIIFKNLEFKNINTEKISQIINKILDLNTYEKAQNLLNLQNIEF